MIGVFVFASAESYGMLLLSQVILAAGSCTGFVGAGYVGGQWFGMARFSFMFGLVQVFAALTSAFSVNIFEGIRQDGGAVRRVALHAVDALGLVHALILRLQALMLPITTLVFSGH